MKHYSHCSTAPSTVHLPAVRSHTAGKKEKKSRKGFIKCKLTFPREPWCPTRDVTPWSGTNGEFKTAKSAGTYDQLVFETCLGNYIMVLVI